jgi:hypothetical protein
MRRLERFPVDARFMKHTTGSPTKPSQQFPQDGRAANAKKGYWPRLPQQHVDELVHLRIWHAPKSSIFIA